MEDNYNSDKSEWKSNHSLFFIIFLLIVNSFILISAMKNFWASQEMRILFFFFKNYLVQGKQDWLESTLSLYIQVKKKNKLSKNYNYKIFSSIVSRLERKIISIDFNIIDLLIKLK